MLDSSISINEMINGSFVYLLFDGEEIVYVGQSTVVGSRLASHAKNKKFTHVSVIKTAEPHRLALESALINIVAPKYNKTGRANPTADDFATAHQYGVYPHGKKIGQIEPFEPEGYGPVILLPDEYLVGLGESKDFDELYEFVGHVGFYDDDEYECHCEPFYDQHKIEMDDLSDEARKNICEQYGCEVLAIVYFGSWSDGYKLVPRDRLKRINSDNDEFYEKVVDRMYSCFKKEDLNGDELRGENWTAKEP